jgi:tellurite resistance protein TerC
VIRKLGAVSYTIARRIVVGVIGGTILLGGFIMILTPGPGLAAILLGLAILAVEFTWAKLWLAKVKHSVTSEGRQALRGEYQRLRDRWFGSP